MPRKPSAADRRKLLDAADRLARDATPSGLTVRKICAGAGVTPKTFRRLFRSRDDYLQAVQQRFMDSIRDRIVEAGGRHPVGYDRLLVAGEAYLDACLDRQHLRAWLAEARKRQPTLGAAVGRHNEVYKLLLAADFRRLGWAHPKAAAALFVAMLMEAGELELRVQRRLPDVRAALREFLQS